jgi:hypothetical protein
MEALASTKLDIDKLPIVFDKVTSKSGEVIPLEKQDLFDKKGVVRYFYNDEKTPNNNWQLFDDVDFEIIGSLYFKDSYIAGLIDDLLANNPHDKNMYDFYKSDKISELRKAVR